MGAKTIRLQPIPEQDEFHGKISLEVMRSIWNEKGKEFTDEQLLKMREWVYLLVETIHKATKTATQRTALQLNQNNYDTEKSDTVCESEYRRAS